MFFLFIDLIVNKYFLLPSFLIVLNLKSNNYYAHLITLFIIIFVLNSYYLGLVYIFLCILYKYLFKLMFPFFKDMLFLCLFLIILNNNSFFITIFYNFPFLLISNIYFNKSICISGMIKNGYKRRYSFKNEKSKKNSRKKVKEF